MFPCRLDASGKSWSPWRIKFVLEDPRRGLSDTGRRKRGRMERKKEKIDDEKRIDMSDQF